MANISNNFLKGKMNKDLDARLLQNGEYRNAINAQVSKSEGANVGALENVLGNTLVQDFNTLTQTTDLKSIGYLTDEINNTVYVFLTNNKFAKYNAANKNFIISYNSLQQTYVVLVQGPFLNFSQLNPIYGVNILEGLLFWTDNRNQPRKINVVSANTLNYYTTEDQISVATYNPYESIELFEIITPAMVTANPELAPAQGDYQTTMFDVTSKFYPNGGSAFSSAIDPLAVDTGFTVPIPLSDATAEGDITAGVRVSYINNDGVMVNTGVTVVTAPTIGVPSFTTSADISAYVSTTTLEFVFDSNPYYENTFTGDSEFLKDKFVRFSYRFQFDDNEYSIFAPFTQPTFIPEQDGYFMYNKDWHDLTAQTTDEQDTYRSTIVDFMENKVTKIGLRIPLPSTKATLQSLHKITSIDILYKESDALAVKVIDTIPIENIVAQTVEPEIFTYNYNSKKPFKTLPSDEIIRVFDKVPVKAFSQEISANRVIYGNFQTKHTPPASIDYSVGVNLKEDNTATITPRTIKSAVGKLEYPSSTLKQNRTYQVGVVLSDRYGRQSTVILSNQDASQTNNSQEFGGSTTYTGYLGSSIDKAEFPGNALRVLFNQPISPAQPNSNTGWPGIYNGDANVADYNPLGWYSYKIVVKQQEQEYYNVYLPGVMAAYPNDKELELGKTSHAVLINDNINKVPRDLSEVGPTQRQFRSSVVLNGRVENNTGTDAGSWNNQYYPGTTNQVVSTIAGNNDLFNAENAASYIPSAEFYNIDSNPLIARISNVNKFGIPATVISATNSSAITNSATINALANNVGTVLVGMSVSGFELPSGLKVLTVVSPSEITVSENISLPINTVLIFTPSVQDESVQKLAILETDGVESLLDIFWETTSTGLVNELNDAILDSTTSSSVLSNWNPTGFGEEDGIGSNVSVTNFQLVDNFGTAVPYVAQSPAQLQLHQVTDVAGNNRESDFTWVDNSNGTYNIITATTFYFSYENATNDTFNFIFEANVNGVQTFIPQNNVSLENYPPTLSGCPADFTWTTNHVGNLADLEGINGSASSTEAGLDLEFDLVVTDSSGASYGPSTGMSVPGNGSFTIDTSPGTNKMLAVINFADGVIVDDGVYTFVINLLDAGNDDGNSPCEFVMTVNNAGCCAWQGFLPLLPYATDVFFNFTNCQGEAVSLAYPFGLQGTTTFLCSLGAPTITYNLNGIPETNTTAFVGPLCGPYNTPQGPPNCN